MMKYRGVSIMNSKTMGFLGAGLLIVGLFLPIATVPFLGSVTLMSNGFNIVAIGLLIWVF